MDIHQIYDVYLFSLSVEVVTLCLDFWHMVLVMVVPWLYAASLDIPLARIVFHTFLDGKFMQGVRKNLFCLCLRGHPGFTVTLS